MADRVLSWSAFGGSGSTIGNGSSVDTGGVRVTVGFNAQDHGATLKTSGVDQYTRSGEPFADNSGAELFGQGGEGGIDDTSKTTLDFSATDGTLSDNVSDVSFRINDIDRGTPHDDHIDIVTIRAWDADGNPVDVTLTAEDPAKLDVSGNTATGITVDDSSVAPDDALASLLVEIDGPVSRIEIDYDNGEETDQKVFLTDVHFSTVSIQDGIVDGTEGSDRIDLGYLDDPEGDRIDNSDAILPGEAPQDDIVDARAGHDLVEAGLGDDDVYGGAGNDTVFGESGDYLIFGDSDFDGGHRLGAADELSGGDGVDTVFGEGGNDLISGGGSGDELHGGIGNDTIYGGNGGESGSTTTFSGTLGFSGLPAGTLVSSQFASSGVTISSDDPDHPVMIFDAANPTGHDWDLHQPHLGNVLILSEDKDSSDPDDNADGGTMRFDFDGIARVESVKLLDVEEGATVRLFDADGNELAKETGHSSNGGTDKVHLGVDDVAYMTVHFNGSGALDNLEYHLVSDAPSGEADGDDTITGGDGSDLIYGQSGDDLVEGGTGNDTIYGDNGDLPEGGTVRETVRYFVL